MAGAVDNLIALIEDGETFGISETQMRNCKFFLPAVKQKINRACKIKNGFLQDFYLCRKLFSYK